MNERNEIGGDLQDEYRELQEIEAREREEANAGAPIDELDADELEDWYQSWLAEQDDPASIDPEWCERSRESWIRCPDCQEAH